MHRTSVWIATWLLSVLAVIIGLGSLYRPLYVRLVDHGVATQGVVSGIRPKPHDLVDYEYAVGGQKLHDCQYPFWPNPSPYRLHVGQTVALTYNSQKPAESLLGDPRSKLQNENITILLVALFFPFSFASFTARAFDRTAARA